MNKITTYRKRSCWIYIMVLILTAQCFRGYALDPSLTLEDHIRIRQQQREDEDKNREILEKKLENQRIVVMQKMEQSPFQTEKRAIPRSGKLMNTKRKYIQWIILAFLLAAMLFVHYRTKKQTE